MTRKAVLPTGASAGTVAGARDAVPAGPPAGELPNAVFDPARLAAVAASGLLDTAPEGTFDDLAQLALAITGAQKAFFTVADGRRSFWKTALGIEPGGARENDIRDSPCHVLIGTGKELIAEDAAADPRVRDLAAVDALGIGAWAGFPVVSPDGHVLGGFCVVDKDARPFTAEQSHALRTLARSVSSEIALRQALRQARASGDASAALARTLQDSLLPPRLPNAPGLDVAAVHLPADSSEAAGTEVVGDFYDLFRTRGESWCAVMGDVCGKGIDAAKVTALARYTLRAEATQHTGPATVLHRLHEAVAGQRVSERFLTVALAVFGPDEDGDGVTGRYASAGHPPALVRRADGTVEELDATGMLLSPLLPPTRDHLADTAFHLRPGDALLLYTDGITEARDGRGPLFGEDRLAEALAATHGADAATTLAALWGRASEHSGGQAADDTALMLLRVAPLS
ncbi:PP2C family protein-serine/threonine phosphatase [Streptomyces corynorhini]|uniref:GAF domain-containing protein n=1 Tax=Streptomyces corynorhini TaxID=2282652 RepID=A0A370B5Q6_9ACTN|nr:GAF domain-containing SpoIIE family protein phosphatase [Streptomyces corynorhini]RDG37148.1 GAF domain-containing protein [Streptomyces corynorhini]